jgi:hypothetical protein
MSTKSNQPIRVDNREPCIQLNTRSCGLSAATCTLSIWFDYISYSVKPQLHSLVTSLVFLSYMYVVDDGAWNANSQMRSGNDPVRRSTRRWRSTELIASSDSLPRSSMHWEDGVFCIVFSLYNRPLAPCATAYVTT